MGGGVQDLNVPTFETINNVPHGLVLTCLVDIDEAVLKHVKGYLAYLGCKNGIETIPGQFFYNLHAHMNSALSSQVFVVIEVLDFHGVAPYPDNNEIGCPSEMAVNL